MRKTWIVVASVAVIVFVAWYRGWFSGEPTYHGKTVTQWLDSMALFDEDRNAELTGQNTFRYQRSPEVVTNDPALHALLLSGSNTVPVLVKRLTEPFQWPRTIGPVSRLRIWAEWKWYRLRNPGSAAPRPAPNGYGSFQRARHMAAALALLALGTDANAEFRGSWKPTPLHRQAPPATATFRCTTQCWSRTQACPIDGQR